MPIMGWHNQLIGLFVFFAIINTITVGLRVFVRTKLTKGAFGWDDVALIFTHVSPYWHFTTPHILKLYVEKTC